MTAARTPRERWEGRAQGWISGAIDAPVGAAFYVVWGWAGVIALAVSSLVLAIGTIAWLTWQEVHS